MQLVSCAWVASFSSQSRDLSITLESIWWIVHRLLFLRAIDLLDLHLDLLLVDSLWLKPLMLLVRLRLKLLLWLLFQYCSLLFWLLWEFFYLRISHFVIVWRSCFDRSFSPASKCYIVVLGKGSWISNVDWYWLSWVWVKTYWIELKSRFEVGSSPILFVDRVNIVPSLVE